MYSLLTWKVYIKKIIGRSQSSSMHILQCSVNNLYFRSESRQLRRCAIRVQSWRYMNSATSSPQAITVFLSLITNSLACAIVLKTYGNEQRCSHSCANLRDSSNQTEITGSCDSTKRDREKICRESKRKLNNYINAERFVMIVCRKPRKPTFFIT